MKRIFFLNIGSEFLKWWSSRTGTQRRDVSELGDFQDMCKSSSNSGGFGISPAVSRRMDWRLPQVASAPGVPIVL